MDQELNRRLVIGVTGCLICLLFAYVGKKSIDKRGGALAALGFLFFGYSTFYSKSYKLVHLRQNDGLRGHEILATFDQISQQIDVKTFMYYCTPCAKEELLAHLIFLGIGNGFTIKYFLPGSPNVLPEEDEIKTLKEEEWIID